MDKKRNIRFWLIALSLMVIALCLLSLQLIKSHRENEPKISTKQRNALPIAPTFPKETSKVQEVVEEPEVPKIPVDRRPRAMPSKKMLTPKLIREYDRTIFDVPHDGNCGFWAILRGMNPDSELIRSGKIMELKRTAAKYAAKVELGPSQQTIERMFGGNEVLGTDALPYVSGALKRDIIVSSSDGNFGYDLFTAKGETFHYDSIDEISREASDEKTVWLHNINNAHWVVAIPEKIQGANPPEEEAKNGNNSSEQSENETYFLFQ
ncbi:MAG: hypothetical protein LBI77_01800 [Puniceicoccales bacterium]|jgi:hypothetical protein|nr:hypothetical protein [Puniceicoccales bacterium]